MILIVSLILSMALTEISYPDIPITYDKTFSVQLFLDHRHNFLADYRFDSGKASAIIEHWCKAFNINQRIVLTRMQVEYNIFSGHVEGEWWIYPYFHRPCKLKYVLNQICGYGLLKRYGRKYLGFENQVYFSAMAARRDWEKFHHFPFVLYRYDQVKSSVEKFYMAWKWMGFERH